MKKLFMRIIAFFSTFLLFYIYACIAYPADENGYLTAPESYTNFMVIFPVIAAIIAPKIFTHRRSPRKNRIRAVFGADNQQLEPQIHHDIGNQQWNVSSDTIEIDALADRAASVIFETGQASVSMLQRKMKLEYEPAVRIMDQLEAAGVVSGFSGNTPRKILISQAEYEHRRCIISRESYLSTHYAVRGPASSDEFAQYGGIDAALLTIDLMEGHDFEYWCADLLRKLDFQDVEVTPGSGDQGVDILAEKDGIRYAIQCKCYASNLGNTPVQEVHSGKDFYHCQIGAVMTNRHFTSGAIELAKATGTLLWDRDWIAERL